MKTFIIAFRTGLVIVEQAARALFEPPVLILYDADDNEVLKYQDSDISSCVEAE